MKPNDKPSQGMYDAWHDDPSNWKLGIFYYNKLDKRVFPPKRIQGFGWTVNFAHPYSYWKNRSITPTETSRLPNCLQPLRLCSPVDPAPFRLNVWIPPKPAPSGNRKDPCR